MYVFLGEDFLKLSQQISPFPSHYRAVPVCDLVKQHCGEGFFYCQTAPL